MTDIIKKLIRDYFIIFGCTLFIITNLRLLFIPQAFELEFIQNVMLFSLLGDLLSLILYTSKETSDKELKIRYIIHFSALEVVLITFGYISGLVTEPISMMILATQIAAIYLMIRFFMYHGDKNTSNLINEKLKELKKTQ